MYNSAQHLVAHKRDTTATDPLCSVSLCFLLLHLLYPPDPYTRQYTPANTRRTPPDPSSSGCSASSAVPKSYQASPRKVTQACASQKDLYRPFQRFNDSRPFNNSARPRAPSRGGFFAD